MMVPIKHLDFSSPGLTFVIDKEFSFIKLEPNTAVIILISLKHQITSSTGEWKYLQDMRLMFIICLGNGSIIISNIFETSNNKFYWRMEVPTGYVINVYCLPW